MATTRAKNFYNQYDIRRYVDENNFSVIMDTANAKYNQAQWRMLGNWDTPSDSKTWSQGTKTVPIMARASLLSTHGLKPMRNTSGWKFYTGSTPKFGHGYTMDEDDMFLLRDDIGEPYRFEVTSFDAEIKAFTDTPNNPLNNALGLF